MLKQSGVERDILDTGKKGANFYVKIKNLTKLNFHVTGFSLLIFSVLDLVKTDRTDKAIKTLLRL